MIFDLTDSWATLCQVETNRGAIKADLSPFSGTSKASWRPLKTILSLFLFQVRREERRKRRSQPQTHKLVPRKEIFRNFQVTQHWLDLWKVLLFYGISTVKWPLKFLRKLSLLVLDLKLEILQSKHRKLFQGFGPETAANRQQELLSYL